MAEPLETHTLSECSGFLSAFIGLIGVLLGSWIVGRSAQNLEESKSIHAITIRLFDEFHSDEMHTWRVTTYRAFTDKSGMSFSQILDSLSNEERKESIMFFHYLEKIGALRESRLVDDALLKNILGRYFRIWFDDIIEKFGPEKEGSEWEGMLNKIRTLNVYKSPS